MATLLEKYTDLRTELVEKVMNGVLPLDKVLYIRRSYTVLMSWSLASFF